MKRLHGMKHLQKLWLNSTEVSDEGVAHLEKLKSLRELHISENKISETALRALRSALPRCRILVE